MEMTDRKKWSVSDQPHGPVQHSDRLERPWTPGARAPGGSKTPIWLWVKKWRVYFSFYQLWAFYIDFGPSESEPETRSMPGEGHFSSFGTSVLGRRTPLEPRTSLDLFSGS